MNQWYVIAGGPGCGKTTTVNALAKRGYKTVHEAARAVIEEANAAGVTTEELRKDEPAFQDSILQRKLTIEETLDPNEITIFDRGLHDTEAYVIAYNIPISTAIKSALSKNHYKKVFILDELIVYEQNDSRIENQKMANYIHKLHIQVYQKYGMKPIMVPVMPVEDRVDFIIEHIEN
jgi:predicted ATPase